MAEEDKQFEASPHKLRKAREEGQVIKSQDLSTALFLIVMFFMLMLMAPFIWKEIARMFTLIFEQIPNATLEKIGWQYLAFLTVRALLLLIGPFLLVAFLTAIITNVLQIGLMIATKPLVPNFEKLDPVKGFKNIFSMRTVVELIKNILKMVILGIVGFLVFKEFFPQLMLLGGAENIFSILGILGQLLGKFILLVGIAFLVIGGADYLFQRWKFMKDQKMSFKELKDEFKQMEGDPMVKQALRQRRMQMLQQRMLEAVPTADVVTTNPIHMAVAIKYSAEEMDAPRVVAKGTELFAEQIKTIAREHGIPVIENPPVAQALFRLVEVDQEIPPDLYQAVAEILMFAWRIQGKAVPAAVTRPDPPPGET